MSFISPANATLEVNDSVWSVNDDGTSMNFVDFGTYTYRVRAQGYQGDAGIVKVDNPDKPKIVPVSLNVISLDMASGNAIDGTSQNASQPLPTTPPEGMLPGVFSVGQTKKVQFSRGNLQYKASANTWRFAANQWDVYGMAYSTTSNDDWIDLFAWGTGNNPILKGLSSKFSRFVDWGTNEIYGCVNRWYTLSCEEWEYVFNKRNTASGIRFAKAVVNGVNGVILLPDEWRNDVYRLNFINDKNASYQGNAISASTWTDVFEPQGAVFLPAAGFAGLRKTFKMGKEGVYWSATPKVNDTYANYLQFDSGGLTSEGWSYGRGAGASVRLVCPAWD